MHGYSVWVNATVSGRLEKMQDIACVNGKQAGPPDLGYDICCYQLKLTDIDEVELESPDVAFPD